MNAWQVIGGTLLTTVAVVGAIWAAPTAIYTALIERQVCRTIDAKMSPVVERLDKLIRITDENAQFQAFVTLRTVGLEDLKAIEEQYSAMKRMEKAEALK